MPRKLNPDYLRRVMAQDELRGMEVVYLTGYIFNVSTTDERLPAKGKCIGTTSKGGQLLQIQTDYHGWTKEGKLYCRKCWASLGTVPREIMRRNWCETCNAKLYSEEDTWLDMRGFELYRDWVTRYMRIAVHKYLQCIEGCEHLLPNGWCMQEDYHKDHIYSVRDGFENDIPPSVVSAPPNLRMIHGKPNLLKGRKSDRTLEEMLAKYNAFLQVHPEWPEMTQQFYSRQETFICEP